MGKQYTVTGMELTNSSGSAVVDANGVVSTTNFNNSSYEGSAQISTSGTSWVSVSGGTITNTLVRTTNVLVGFSCVVSYSGTNGILRGAEVTIAINGTTQSNFPPGSYFQDSSGGTVNFTKNETLSFSKIYSMASGTNSIALQWRSISSELVYMNNRTLNYVVLGN